MPRILIVDDDRTTVRLLKTLLELDGFEVSVAPRGADAVALARQERPDLFLVDYHLSDMHGVELVTAIRADADLAPIPVVITSGMNVEKETTAAGASAFLMKPFDPEKLTRLFRNLIQP